MSRIGLKPVTIIQGVECKLSGREFKAKGKIGELSLTVPLVIGVNIGKGQVTFKPSNLNKETRMLWGTTRSLVHNIIVGVGEGFIRRLEINGVGYRAAVQGNDLVLQLGFSHEVRFPIPSDVTIKCDKPTLIVISGVSRQRVGQVAAEIRSYRKPEPYKGKGIKFENEYIIRKEGKKK
jgi:large subunit ribosomal protein L6